MKKTFVIGDIHGARKALIQCLERSDFNIETDHLISLGDVCDGWPETRECIDELMKVKNLTYILGNHDLWTLEWMKSGFGEDVWLRQGGKATVDAYREGVPLEHVHFLQTALPYYHADNKLFVHAGIDPLTPVDRQGLDIFLWDRTLARKALDHYVRQVDRKFTTYEEVYIGHTPVPFSNPVHVGDVWMMDTGAGWSGILSMMNVETKEIFTSDPVTTLYPGVEGRRRN